MIVDADKESLQGQSAAYANSQNGKNGEKPSRKKRVVFLIVAAVVLAVAVASFVVWHGQPAFCNAVCHSPMDSYVENYYSDKVQYMVTAHARANVTCLQCHPGDIGEQVQEGIKWIQGDYTNPLTSRAPSLGSRTMCLSCHDEATMVAATESINDGLFNPHAVPENHEGGTNLACGLCHRSHTESQLYCNTCHSFSNPEGWVNPGDDHQ